MSVWNRRRRFNLQAKRPQYQRRHSLEAIELRLAHTRGAAGLAKKQMQLGRTRRRCANRRAYGRRSVQLPAA